MKKEREEEFLFSSFIEFNKCWRSGTKARVIMESFNGVAFVKGNAHVNFSKPIAENVQGHNSAIFEATDPIFWELCLLGCYF